MNAFRTDAEFARSLRAAEHEHAENGGFAASEIEDFLNAVLVLRDAALCSADGTGKLLVFEAVESLAHFGFVQMHFRIAIIFLIAGVDQRVEGERVVLGRGRLFFNKRAEDAGFHGIDDDGHD